MNVAALYDIHGNLPALEAALREVRAENVEAIVVGGDLVPGPMPRECLAALLDCGLPVHFIVGNGEQNVLAAHDGEEMDGVPEKFRDALRWTAEQLTEEEIALLRTWPLTHRIGEPGRGAVFCHATPRDADEIFTRLTPAEHLEPVLAKAEAPIVVCGHTHMQFDRMAGSIRAINAGSVGMPFGDPGAHWLLLDPDSGRAALRRTEYDYAAAAARIQATEYPRQSEMDPGNPMEADPMLRLLESVALGRE
jgi:diadenosine tetraphosphatase ApaH/serine/threonine PP2A family protein phosphatase